MQQIKTKRSVSGKIVKWTFIIFNIIMALWVIGGFGAATKNMDAMSNAERAGASLGTGIGIVFLLLIWGLGDIILGILVMISRPKVILVGEDNVNLTTLQKPEKSQNQKKLRTRIKIVMSIVCFLIVVLFIIGSRKINPEDSFSLVESQSECQIKSNEKTITGYGDACKRMTAQINKISENGWINEGMPIKASQVFNDYQSNEARADSFYKGKGITVEGSIKEISKDISDDIYLKLSVSNRHNFNWIRADLSDVHVTQKKDSKDLIIVNSVERSLELNKGDKIVLSCLGGSMIINIPNLKNCIIE